MRKQIAIRIRDMLLDSNLNKYEKDYIRAVIDVEINREDVQRNLAYLRHHNHSIHKKDDRRKKKK